MPIVSMSGSDLRPPPSESAREGGALSWPGADLKDLETRGFVVVRSFLSEAEVEACREDFATREINAENRNYNLSATTGRADEIVRERVKQALSEVSARTDLAVDLPLAGCYFATARGVSFAWHQDHESFYAIQNHYDYLNFYIPIVKPRPDKSNLSIIPFDALEREYPEAHRLLVKNGAARFNHVEGRILVFRDEPGTTHWVEGDLDHLAHTPELAAGDLLLIRGDVIHRTQDTETERVSLSFRATSAATIVERRRLTEGGLPKAWMMMNDARTYERMFMAFDALGRGRVPYGELQAAIDALPPSDSMGRKRFARYLLRRKLREGVLLRFFWNTLRTWLTAVGLVLKGHSEALAWPGRDRAR